MNKAKFLCGAAYAASVILPAAAQTQGSAAATPAVDAAAPAQAGVPSSTGTDAARAAPQASTTGGDIIVTAQRRSEALQDVPVAVSVFTSDDRTKTGVETIQDFANVAPGLTFSATLDRLVLRGVGRLTNTIGSDPGVAVYNDGFYTSSNAEASKSPMFVERVEVLRGPQGTLYGRNSVGGAINVVSKRPTDTLTGEFWTQFDNYNGLISQGYLSGPIVGGLKARLSVEEGPIPGPNSYAFHNIGPGGNQGNQKRFLVEGQLEYDFSDRAQIWFKYSHAEWDDSYGTANLVTPYDGTSLFPAGALVPNPAYGYTVANPGVADPRIINTNTTQNDRLTNNHNFVVNAFVDVGPVTLKYVGGYAEYRYTLYTDLDGTARDKTVGVGGAFGFYTYNPTYIQQYIEDKHNFSNELTLSNNDTGGRLNYIVGAYQYHENYYQPVTWYQGGDGSDNMAAALANPACLNQSFAPTTGCGANLQRAFYRGTGTLVTDSYAGYGQLNFEVVPKVKITAGLRYSSDTKTGDESYRLVQYNPTGGGLTPFYSVDITRGVICGGLADCAYAGTGTAYRTLHDTWTGPSWKLGVDYKPDARTLIYANYSRGLKSGGFNLGSFAANPEVTTEKVDSYEVGLKSRPLRALTFNLTGFYYDFRNAQIPITVPLGTTALTTTNFYNIPKSRSYGAEIETSWNVTPRFDVTATYSYLDAKLIRGPQLFDDPNQPGFNPVSINGNRLPGASKHKVYVSGLYDVPLGADQGHVFVSASYAYRSDAYYDVFQSRTGRAPGWDQVDGRLTYVDPTQRFTFIVYARNIFNSLGYDYASGNNGTGAAGYGQTYSYTPPRQVGAEMHVKF